MRQLKFRAWDGEQMTQPCNLWDRNDSPIEWLNSLPFPNSILMQYTGLKDKNGKEIYEGDILQAQIASPRLIYEVKVVNGAWAETKPDGYVHYFKDMVDNWSRLPFETVIGNIYENKELLD